MIESLKSLFVVGVLAFGAFIYARMAFADIIAPGTIGRWRTLFLAVTAIAFLVPNYWLMLAALAAVVVIFGAAENFKPALYLLLIFAVPAAGALVPGFGGINNFLQIFPFNVLAIVVLFPLLLRASDVKGGRGGALADAAFIGYAVVVLALAFRDTTATDGIRQSTAFVLTAVPQYFVFSRIRWTTERLRLATAALVIPLIALAAVAVAEVVLSWHVYNNAVHTWGIDVTLRYVERSGFLRAYGPIFGPIAFGLFLVVGLALAPALAAGATKKRFAYLTLPALAAGLLATFSRGPWVGGVVAIGIYVATTRRYFANLARLAAAGIAGFVVLSLTPFGGALIEMLPFVGDVEGTTIGYRQRLFDVGWGVVMETPLFGSEGYLETEAMQSLVQGQGIVDIVNAYLRIALDSGLVGLALYVGAVGFSMIAAWRSIRRARRISAELASYCQSYLAALLGLSFTLATTTNTIGQIQEVTWVLCGICVGLARSVSIEQRVKVESPAPATIDAGPGAPPGPPDVSPPGRPLPAHLRQYERR